MFPLVLPQLNYNRIFFTSLRFKVVKFHFSSFFGNSLINIVKNEEFYRDMGDIVL
jgi:hypothetical protein